jgi:hypothetical protein
MSLSIRVRGRSIFGVSFQSNLFKGLVLGWGAGGAREQGECNCSRIDQLKDRVRRLFDQD